MKKILATALCAFAFAFNALADGGEKPKEKKQQKPNGITVKGYATNGGVKDDQGRIHITCKESDGICISQVQKQDVFVNGKNGNLLAQYTASADIVVHSRQTNPTDTEITLESEGDILRVQ